ncbi:Uridylate kinase [Drechslerella dactyloides]|uniref:Uridylate kinase n=1 Tax=Drechslerella dactyloides TaxID=74499 RepID=A0AAD6NKC9_DREDA|nr:Uridylate kinase [Drechslerella dactyloides]
MKSIMKAVRPASLQFVSRTIATRSLPSIRSQLPLPRYNCLRPASSLSPAVLSVARRSTLGSNSRHYTTGHISGPGAPRPPKDNKLKAWPFILIFVTGAVAFAAVLENRKDKPKPMPPTDTSKSLPKLRDDGPVFSPDDVKVIFVLGGPGVGKGTQCANLVKDYHFVHLSAGDLLREERTRSGTEYGELIETYIKEGKIVPMEVTIVLLENAMKKSIEAGKHKFLIDGFPRQMDQALKFEEVVVPSQFTLFFDCDEETMTKRITERGKTSGRSDDNPESMLKRFRTFNETSMPVVNYFDGQKKVVKVDGAKSVDAVYADVKAHIADRLK